MRTLPLRRPFPSRRLLALALLAPLAGMPASAADYPLVAGFARSAATPVPDTKPASAALKRGLKAVRKGDGAAALKVHRTLKPGVERNTLGWVLALRGKGVDAASLARIAAELPHWPGQETMRAHVERSLLKEAGEEALAVAFSADPPRTVEARLALARYQARKGNRRQARALAASVWKDEALDAATERGVLRDLGTVLTKADHEARVEYLLSKERVRGAERIAGKAGMTRLVAARAAVLRKRKDAGRRLAAVPASQKKWANWAVSQAMHLRRRERITQAANTLLAVPAKRIHSRAADDFWRQSRILASDLLEAGKPRLAYRLAARGVARSDRRRMDEAFLAGWIALRKLKDPRAAETHFRRLSKIAKRPISVARANYWLGRAAKAAGRKGAATNYFKRAARHDTVFYGQLAARALGRTKIAIDRPAVSGSDRTATKHLELTQAIAKLESGGEARLARTLYRHVARVSRDEGTVAILAARAERRGDHQLGLQMGKIAFGRGLAVDTVAWPVGAIPRGTKVGGTGLAMAYAIARQESTFQVDARSSADALGLLQLLPGTAKRVARSQGLAYSRRRLVTDAAYNARLGTAYFEQQRARFGGSYVLTLAAYNAGPRRAAEWIERFGDPRGMSTEGAIDWIEQIPFSETRNYVMRVMENYQVYKTRLNGAKLTLDRDIGTGRRG